MTRSKFSFKTFTSFLITMLFLMLILSGTMLYVSPPGRVAHWTGWTLLGGSKEQWGAVHSLMALVFLIGGLFHLLKFNWTVFLDYLKRKKNRRRYSRELIAAVALFGLVMAGTLAEVPPFKYVMDLSETIKNSWEPEEVEAPIAHMEEQTLEQVAQFLKIEPQKAVDVLTRKGFDVAGLSQTLKEVGAANHRSPRQIFQELQRASGYSGPVGGVPRQGVGRMTVGEVADTLGLNMDEVNAILKANGIEAVRPDERMRNLATRLEVAPPELLEMLRQSAH